MNCARHPPCLAFLRVLGSELRPLCLWGEHLTHWPYSQPPCPMNDFFFLNFWDKDSLWSQAGLKHAVALPQSPSADIRDVSLALNGSFCFFIWHRSLFVCLFLFLSQQQRGNKSSQCPVWLSLGQRMALPVSIPSKMKPASIYPSWEPNISKQAIGGGTWNQLVPWSLR